MASSLLSTDEVSFLAGLYFGRLQNMTHTYFRLWRRALNALKVATFDLTNQLPTNELSVMIELINATLYH